MFRLCQIGRCHSLEGGFCLVPRTNSNSDEVGVVIFQQNDALKPDLQKEVESTISTDMRKRICSCLLKTVDVLQSEYPEEKGDVIRHERRSHSDLSDLACALDEIRQNMQCKVEDSVVFEGSKKASSLVCVPDETHPNMSNKVNGPTILKGGRKSSSPVTLLRSHSSPDSVAGELPSSVDGYGSQTHTNDAAILVNAKGIKDGSNAPLSIDKLPRSHSTADDCTHGPAEADESSKPACPVKLPRSHSTAESFAAKLAGASEAAQNGATPSLENAKALAHEGMLDHEQLIGAIYASQGLDLHAIQLQAREFIKSLGLKPVDMGVVNIDDKGQQLLNQCFYLSLARGYLGPAAPAEALALRFRNAIEASVLKTRPAWADKMGLGTDGDNGIMAFADFLPLAMQAEAPPNKKNILSQLVVCILDSVGGHVEVYIGPNYDALEKNVQERNLILLLYTPGHYHCMVRDDEAGSKFNMAYSEFKELLTHNGVVFIETNE